MSKVMLVEDDNNLREIYEARLQAEGYTIVTAHDGEEALAVAKTEMPDLIISDVMMPKISGFEMLDILRNTDGLKDVKVIMLTALGQSDDQQRADRLGADSYLVKSQVTLEDIVKVAGRLLGNEDTSAVAATPLVVEPVAAAALAEAPAELPAEPTATVVPEPVIDPVVTASTVDPVAPVAPVAFGASVVAAPSEPAAAAAAAPVATTTDDAFLQSLGASTEATVVPSAQPVAEEAATVEAQIASFEKAAITAPTEVDPAVPATEIAPDSAPVAAAPEQFVTTAAPDLTITVDPTNPAAQSAGNDDVLADALQSLTGQAPEVINVTAGPPAAEAAPASDPAVARGGNRVITPLDAPTKPDLSTLLALEEAKETANAPVAVQPANTTIVATPAPSTASATPAVEPTNTPPVVAATPATPPEAAQPFDPNSIAL